MSAPKKDRNSELMRSMGSKTGRYDPEPPDVNLHALHHGCAQSRLIAWVKSKTVAYGHNSPYCVDGEGKALTAEHAAGDLGWKVHTVKNELTKLVKAGVVRLDVKRERTRIWLCADIPQARKATTEIGVESSVQGILPTYLVDFIQNLPAEKRGEIKAKYEGYLQWRLKFFADVMAVARATDEQIEDTLLHEIGLPKKRGKKKDRQNEGQLTLTLLEAPSFVQGTAESPVQGTEATAYNAGNGSVQRTPIITDSSENPEGGGSVSRSSLSASSGTADRPTDSPESVRKLLLEELAHLHENPSQKLCEGILTAMGGAPLPYLRTQIHAKREKFKSMGFALELAKDVGTAWRSQQGARDAAEQRRTDAEAQEAQKIAEMLETPKAQEVLKSFKKGQS